MLSKMIAKNSLILTSAWGDNDKGIRVHIAKLLDWRKTLIYAHRWAGILLTAVFVVWFVSGIVFVYVGMPTLPAEERLWRMEPLDLSALRVTPAAAAASAGIKAPTRVRVAMSGGRPVYRFQSGTSWRMVYADTGAPLTTFGSDDAMAVMRRFTPGHAGSLRYPQPLTRSPHWAPQ